MASKHPELAEITIKAAQWIIDSAVAGDLPPAPILPAMRQRFGLTQVQAVQAFFEAIYSAAKADGRSHEQAFRAGLMALAEEARRTGEGGRP